MSKPPQQRLRTLTVQDVLWINLQVTGRVNHYSNARLEEATYYQFAYGDSQDLEAQAARLLAGFVRMHPFEAGNEATALGAALSFLRLNGKALTIGADASTDAALAWAVEAMKSPAAARAALAGRVVEIGGHTAPEDDLEVSLATGLASIGGSVREVVTEVLQEYGELLRLLALGTVPAGVCVPQPV